jgi:hypothetical protein
MRGGVHVSKARLIYFAVFAIIIVAALLPALSLWPAGQHDGADF